MKNTNSISKKHKKNRIKIIKNLCLSVFICGLIVWICTLLTSGFLTFSLKIQAEDFQSEIEKAIFTRQEFFGAEAIVPLPTAEARENLAKLAISQPDNSLDFREVSRI